MAVHKNKKELKKALSLTIKTEREKYENARRGNKKIPSFYKSEAYKKLNSKRKKRLYRYDKREEIAQRSKERKQTKEKVKGERLKKIPKMSAFESYSGNGRIFENAIFQKAKDKQFSGIVETIGKTGKKSTRIFNDYSKFRLFINKKLKKLYNKKGDVYEIFNWEITKSFATNENELIIKHVFEHINSEENED